MNKCDRIVNFGNIVNARLSSRRRLVLVMRRIRRRSRNFKNFISLAASALPLFHLPGWIST